MKIFVYETLLNHRTLAGVLKHLPKTRNAILKGYKEGQFKGYPTLHTDKEGSIRGQEFEVSAEDEAKLDRWESHYVRYPVTLSDGSRAFAYIIDPTTFGDSHDAK